MKRLILTFGALMLLAAPLMAQRTVTFTDELDVATAGDGTSIFSATYDPVADKFLGGHGTNVRIYNGTTGAFESNLDITGITVGGLGFFALTVAEDGAIFAFEDGASNIWRWDNISDTSPAIAFSGALFARVGQTKGTGNSTIVAFTGSGAADGPVQIFETADGVTFTEREAPVVESKSAFAAGGPSIDLLYTVGDVGAKDINKYDKTAPTTWTEDTATWAPTLTDSTTLTGGGPMAYDEVNDILFILPMPGQDTVYALDGTTGEELGRDTVTNLTNTTTGYNGGYVAATADAGTLWMACRAATASNLAMYKWTYQVLGPPPQDDLDNNQVTDQFNEGGTRGNETGTGGGFGASRTDGTEFADYNGPDTTGGPIRYINTYAGASAGDSVWGESPVVDITSSDSAVGGTGNPDRDLMGNAIPANTRPGATGGNTALIVSDDGGQNTISFGRTNNANYFIEVDVFCPDQSATAGSAWTLVAVRAARDEDQATINSGAYSIDREASYALVYEHSTTQVHAVVFPNDYAGLAGAGIPTPAGSTTVTSGWHTFRIEADGSTIRYFVDGSSVATISDTTATEGRAALGYRETGQASADERGGTFDNLKAGPLGVTAVENWTIYQ